ncbi:hypothetical protein [Cryobacterium sp.]|uniref:hypothetical protein n=1 Tax=Cryobacterium sp. TaxID=1926290 RepID=UPI0026159FDA|nr:hypothetical protein [Cryobacterium sp.]MCU1446091.1 hypothetical protein [Cryobacterium sp.]
MVFLPGCISGSGYSDLDREPSAEDAPPVDLPDYATQTMEPTTMPFVDEVGGWRLYLAEGAESPVCVLAYESETNWVSSCGSSMMTTSSGSYEVMVVSDNMPGEDGWTRAGENLLVKGE